MGSRMIPTNSLVIFPDAVSPLIELTRKVEVKATNYNSIRVVSCTLYYGESDTGLTAMMATINARFTHPFNCGLSIFSGSSTST